MKFTPIAAALCAACVSVPEATYDLDDPLELFDPGGNHHQPRPDVELVAEAVALADLPRLGWQLPDEDALRAADRAPYWHATAMAFAPAVRDARARAEASLARAGSAGAPGPVEGRLVDHEIGGDDVLLESVLTFDLIGLLGLGPSAAAREVADAHALSAVAELERALWRTRFQLDRERATLQADHDRNGRLVDLRLEVQEDLRRVAILNEHGRVAPAKATVAQRQLDVIDVALARTNETIHARRGRLADLCGVDFTTVRPPVDAFELPEVDPHRRLPGTHPEVRAARLAASVAEARLRAAAARSWPALRLGAHLGWPEGDLDPTRVGGLLGIGVPWPSSYEGEFDAAVVERDRAVERYLEVTVALRSAARAADERRETAAVGLRGARRVEEGAAEAWEAMRARFRNGRATLPEWLDALEARRASLFVVIDAHLAHVHAQLDLIDALGPEEVRP